MIAIYRSPSLESDIFVTSLDLFLRSLPNDSNILIIGDIYLNILDSTDGLANEYLSSLQLNGYQSYINKPTRQQKDIRSCLDHIFLKNLP